MVKRKAPAPKRLEPEDQVSWSMGEASSHDDNVVDLIDDSEAICDSKVDVASEPAESQKRQRTLPNARRSCHSHLTVHWCPADDLGPKSLIGQLGTIIFCFDKSALPVNFPSGRKFWISVGDGSEPIKLYYESPPYEDDEDGDNVGVHITLKQQSDFEVLHALLFNQSFSLLTRRFDRDSGTLSVGVWLRSDCLVELQHVSEVSRTHLKKDIPGVMKHFFSICAPGYSPLNRGNKEDIDGLYSAVKQHHDREHRTLKIDVQHADLQATLCTYQREAVQWMLSKEKCISINPLSSTENQEKKLHCLFSEVKLNDGQIIYYNRYSGIITRTKHLAADILPGGILADEMGLGKTVEVLALILNHPRPPGFPSIIAKPSEITGHSKVDSKYFAESVKPKEFFECVCGCEGRMNNKNEVQCRKCGSWQHANCVKYDPMDPEKDYYCPHCWITMLCESRATLIVAPATIISQWIEEIGRHVRKNSLKVLVYEGVYSNGFIRPRTLADNDVVLVSYQTMRRELNYVDLPHSNGETGRRFRHAKRFMAIPSPLTAVHWWRVCLDEAQMVEATMARAAGMALRMIATNRWCVTGTPIQKRIEDLYGLLLFLGTDPYCVKFYWKQLLFDPYVRGERDLMHEVISSVLWRTVKNDVLNQINIPHQSEEFHWLSFTPVEEHFYRQQHIDCSRDMVARLNNFTDHDVKLDSLDRHTLNWLLAPLLRLRQACVHPQVVRGRFINMRKSTMTMEELLESLVKKAKLESEEAHRLLVSSLNGLAAIHIIKEEWGDAVDKYREVLQSAKELKPQIKTDKLQQFHALHNLAEILEGDHEGIPPTLRDADLRQEAKQVHDIYLEKYLNMVRESRQVLSTAIDAVEELTANFKNKVPWWSSIIGWAASNGLGIDIVDKIKRDLATDAINASIANRFRDTNGLQYAITRQLDDLETSHKELSSAVLALDDEPSSDIIDSAVQCHLRPTVANFKKCIYCNVDALFNRYEAKLFSFNEDRVREVEVAAMRTDTDAPLGQLRHGNWSDSEIEKVLKIVFAFGRQHGRRTTFVPVWLEDGQNHVKVFEALKKEFRGLRGVWMQLSDQASAIDELNMATTRMRLRLQDEPEFDPPRLDVLEPTQVDHQRLKLLSDRIVARNELEKKLGQLKYLTNLSNSDYGKRGGSNPDPCPICQHKLGEQWSVLQCGHCFCIGCIQIQLTNYTFGGRNKTIKCAICRQTTMHGEISYVNTGGEECKDAEEINVLGSHSTKIEAVIRQLIHIKKKDPSAKTLVFSTWSDVLDILAKALGENNLSYTMLANNKKFQTNLDKFKHDEVIDILLLPVHSGANGLNIIQATHIILVEPILNPASELQALGRVHRFGQLKPTVVHRFLVRGTIEERMHSMLKFDTSKVSSHTTEENPLTMHDLVNLFSTQNA